MPLTLAGMLPAKVSVIVRDGGAQDRDLRGHVGGGQQRGRAVRHDQINALGVESVDHGGAKAGVARDLRIDVHRVAGFFHLFRQRVDKTLRGLIQRIMYHQLADADGVVFRKGSAAEGERERDGHQQSDRLFHSPDLQQSIYFSIREG